MTFFKYAIYVISLVVYPIRLTLFYIHKIFVFISKPGARLLVPILMLVASIVLRTRIDAIAGGHITDMFWDFKDGDMHSVYEYRMEITFSIIFFIVYILLWIAAKIMTPIVGALNAPRVPLLPMPPLIAVDHVIKPVKASVALSGGGSRHKGDLTRLNRFLPPQAIAVLEAGAAHRQQDEQTAQRAQEAQKERERQDPPAAATPSVELEQGDAGKDSRKKGSGKPPAAAAQQPSVEGAPADAEAPPSADPRELEAQHSTQRGDLEIITDEQRRAAPAPTHEPREARSAQPDNVLSVGIAKTRRPPRASRRPPPEAAQPQPQPQRTGARRVPKRDTQQRERADPE